MLTKFQLPGLSESNMSSVGGWLAGWLAGPTMMIRLSQFNLLTGTELGKIWGYVPDRGEGVRIKTKMPQF